MNMPEFLLLVLVAAIVLFAVVSQTQPKKKRFGSHRSGGGGRSSLDRDFVAGKWATIQGMMAAGGGSNLKNAISEADKLLDYALKSTGARGQTMGERLKSSGNRFSDINAIWRAHKVRNSLAHESQFDLVASQAREAINDFERGLRDLGAL